MKKRRQDFLKKIRLKEEEMTMFSMEDWEKIMIEEVKRRWENRRKELEEIEEKIEIRKNKKEERRKRVIRERRCFVCGIFGYMAHYCRNREEDKGLVQVPKNRFEVLRDRVMERGERSGKEIIKERREILKKDKVKKEKKMKKEKIEKKEKMREDKEEKIEEEREVEMQGFSRGEILRGRYPLAWWKVLCYECGGIGHKRSDYRKKIEKKIEEKDKREIDKEEMKKQEVKKK